MESSVQCVLTVIRDPQEPRPDTNYKPSCGVLYDTQDVKERMDQMQKSKAISFIKHSK